MTPKQWANLPKKLRDQRTQSVVDSRDWGRKELNKLGLNANFENARKAIEKGHIKWEVKVLQCIGFDFELYAKLVELA